MRKAKPGKPTTIAKASGATWFFVIQICCFSARALSGQTNSFTTGIACFALTLALAGFYDAIRCFRRGDRMQSFNHAAMSTLALLFWTSQLVVAYLKVPPY